MGDPMAKRIRVARPKFFYKSHQIDNSLHHQQVPGVQHPLHFCLTLVTFGLWGLVWWYLILKQQGKRDILTGFDDDYWSYLIEREQPPAALYPQRFSAEQRGTFDA